MSKAKVEYTKYGLVSSFKVYAGFTPNAEPNSEENSHK